MPAVFRNDFIFGAVAAENDRLLPEVYWDNGDFNAIASRDDPRRFLLGRTGSGKSAALQRLEEEYPSSVIRIKPESLSLPYIMDLDVVKKLMELRVHVDIFFKALWKHVLIVEVLKHRYNIDSPEQKRNFIDSIMSTFKRANRPSKLAVEYLQEFGDSFWLETDERIKEVVRTFEQKINTSGGASATIPSLVDVKASAGTDQLEKQEIRSELADRYQRVVNATLLTRLADMEKLLNSQILSSPEHFTYIIIDDLDRDWIDRGLANMLIRCLISAVVDLGSVRNLKILVAMRINILEKVMKDHDPDGLGAKVRGSTLQIRWDKTSLTCLLDERAKAASRHFWSSDPSRHEIVSPGSI